LTWPITDLLEMQTPEAYNHVKKMTSFPYHLVLLLNSEPLKWNKMGQGKYSKWMSYKNSCNNDIN